MEPLFERLKNALQLIGTGEGEETCFEIKKMLTNILEKCFKSGIDLEDLKVKISQLYEGELLINEAEYRCVRCQYLDMI